MRRFQGGAQRASRRRLVLLLSSLAVALLASPPPQAVAAGAVYVSTRGSDAGHGTFSSPWRTIQKAAAAAPAGSTVYIRGGTYAGFTVARPSLAFRQYGTESVVVNGDPSRSFVVRVSGTNHVRISGLTIQGGSIQYGAGVKVDKSASYVTISGNRIRNNRSFGVLLENSSSVVVTKNSITGNETGIQVSWVSSGVQIVSNTIAYNNRMIVNDATASNDRGANGIVFYRASGPITVGSNRIYGHRAASHDYGLDGGALEIYASSNIRIVGNVMFNNLNVLETGTDGTACSNIVFARNVAYGGSDGGARSEGLILRCASSSLIANNTFSDLDDFVYYLTQSGAFAGSIGSLRILNNIQAQTSAKVYSFDAGLPSTMQVDYNLSYNASSGSIAWVSGLGNTGSLSTFRTWTGYDLHGRQGKPLFIDSLLRVASTSPAIDHGTGISGITTKVSCGMPNTVPFTASIPITRYGRPCI